MAENPVLTQYIREALSQLSNVEEKKMFRGLTFMVNGKMCICVADQDIMCRIDPARYDELMKKPGTMPVIMKGSLYKGYIRISADALEEPEILQEWIELALAFNGRAKASKGRSRK